MHPEAPRYGALRIRAEFVQPPRSCLSGIGRDSQAIASGAKTGRDGVVDPWNNLQLSGRGLASAQKSRARQTCRGRDRLRTEVVTSAPNGASWTAACLVTLCFRLTMFRWRIYSAAIATRAVRKFCPDAMACEQGAPAPLPFLFPCLPISSIDAPRGAVGWRRCRLPCIFARGERVHHGKQNDHRRFPPGGNQGGGPTRKSRRGV
jgi:hypothetical protein